MHVRCPMQRLLELLGGPWTTYILWLIRSQGPQRYGQLRRSIDGISGRILTQRLRLLEDEKILSRHQEDSVPPKVTYSMTKRGKQLDKMLDEVNKLAKKWYDGK